ncbi:MAG: LamG domain-containing protein [archaeon]|jgi:hypothetical protein
MKVTGNKILEYLGIAFVILIVLAVLVMGLNFLLNPTPSVVPRTSSGAIEADSNVVTINNQVVEKDNYVAAGLAAMWHFNGDTFDSSGNGLDGQATSVNYIDGMWGKKAINFNGNGYIKVENNSLLNFAPKQGFTIALWVKYSPKENSTILSKMDTNTNSVGFGVYTKQSSEVSLKLADGEKVVYDASIPSTASNYHFLVYSVDHFGNCQRFIDGKLVEKDLCSLVEGVDFTNTSPLYIGANFDGVNTNNYFTGSIQDLSIWRRPLSATEVKEMYDNTLAK